MLNRSDRYTLTIATWLRAVEAGVRQEPAPYFLADGPQYYRPHDWLFANPPTREDWWELCRITPWMSCYEEHRDLIDSNPWPLVLPGFKAASVDLKDSQGRHVGEIHVDRESCYQNKPFYVPFFGVHTREAILRGVRGQLRAQMEEWLRHHQHNEYLIVEEAMRRANAKGVDVTEDLYVKVGKELIRRQFCKPAQPAKAVLIEFPREIEPCRSAM